MLVLFTGSTQSGCGPASAETGPFYCPADRKVYIDLAFFKELKTASARRATSRRRTSSRTRSATTSRSSSGIEEQVRQLQQQDPSRQNELSVKLELQADCLAGVWAQSVYEQGDLELGDIEEGLSAASAVGDDRIQASAGVGVNPETWTHGSAAQRSHVVQQGLQVRRSGGLRHLRQLTGGRLAGPQRRVPTVIR